MNQRIRQAAGGPAVALQAHVCVCAPLWVALHAGQWVFRLQSPYRRLEGYSIHLAITSCRDLIGWATLCSLTCYGTLPLNDAGNR